jgi:hypothetical protein
VRVKEEFRKPYPYESTRDYNKALKDYSPPFTFKSIPEEATVYPYSASAYKTYYIIKQKRGDERADYIKVSWKGSRKFENFNIEYRLNETIRTSATEFFIYKSRSAIFKLIGLL